MRRTLTATVLLGLASVLGAQDFPRVLLPATAATVEGNSGTGFPWGQSRACRMMTAYGADMLPSSEPVRITGLAFRPDGSIAQHTRHILGAKIVLSTCRNPADSLDRTFDNNHGPDRTTVFDGTLDTPALTYPPGAREFSLRFDFQRPFVWDPACGPLVVDLQSAGLFAGLGQIQADGQDDAAGTFGRILHTSDRNATQANYPASGTQRFAPTLSLLVDAVTAPTPVAGFDANSSSSFPWNRNAAMRVQQIYEGSVIGLEGYHRIQALAWRTDGGAEFVGGRTYTMRVTLSTGRAGLSASASTVFASNTGADAKVVFEGDWTPAASSTTLPASPFAQRLELRRPFDYDVRNGSLVVDIQLFDARGAATVAFDGPFNTGVGVARVFDLSSATASSGTVQDFALAMRIESMRQRVVPVGSGSTSTSSFPWGSPAGQRAMYAYSGSGLGVCRPISIERLSWMPDGDLGPVSYTATIDLSTARVPVDGLNTLFDLNHGADRQRVFDGRISGARRTGGGAAKFALSVELDRPFLWDPASGPLVVDLRTPGGLAGLPSGFRGVHGSHGYRVVHRDDPDATNADFGPQNFGLAMQLDGGDGCGAHAIPFGDGCPGANGVPSNLVNRLPQTGESEFSFELRDGPSAQQVALLTGTLRQVTNLGFIGLPACDLELLPNFVTLTTTTDGVGGARFAWPIPLESSYAGATLFTQWLCLDNSAAGGATVSGGLELVFCHQ